MGAVVAGSGRGRVVPPATTARRSDLLAGARAMVPLAAGLVPFGLTIGAAAGRADLPAGLGWVSSVLLYGGSGQLALVEVLDGDGPAVAAVAAVLAVNAQMLLYGTGMRSLWSGQTTRWRAAAAYLLVSPVFAVAAAHHPGEPDAAARRSFYAGAGLALWAVWLVITGIGFVAGSSLPPTPALGLLTPLVLMTMAIRATGDGAGVAAVVVGAAVAAVCDGVPHDLGFVIGGVAGVTVAVLVDGRSAVGRGRGVEQEGGR